MNDGKKRRSSAELPAHKRFEKTTASGELVAVKSVHKNAQPQIENLCSKGAWGTSLNKRVGLSG